MYRYLASVESGVDHEAALSLAGRANLGEDVWEDLGGKAGLKLQAKKLLTLIAAAGRKHTGDRCKLDPIPCLCDASGGEPEAKRARTQAPAPERGMNGLDPSGQGIPRDIRVQTGCDRNAVPRARPQAHHLAALGCR
eukprot:3069119-Prymnesium_polylepis.1